MRTVMRSSANKEVEAIVVQTVDRIGPHANDSLCLVRANIYHRRGPCIGVARSTHSFRPSATSRKRSPVQQPNATGAQPSPARISRAVTAGPGRRGRDFITLTSRANPLRRQPRLQPSHTHTEIQQGMTTYGRWLGDDKRGRTWEVATQDA